MLLNDKYTPELYINKFNYSTKKVKAQDSKAEPLALHQTEHQRVIVDNLFKIPALESLVKGHVTKKGRKGGQMSERVAIEPGTQGGKREREG